MKEVKTLPKVEVLRQVPKQKGLMAKFRDEYDRNTEGMGIIDRIKAKAIGNKEVQRAAVEYIKLSLKNDMDARLDSFALEKYERRANVTITKGQIYDSLVAATRDSQEQALLNLQSFIVKVFESSQLTISTVFDAQAKIVEEYKKKLDRDVITQEKYDKLIAKVEIKADDIFDKMDGAVTDFYQEKVTEFTENIKTFSEDNSEIIENMNI